MNSLFDQPKLAEPFPPAAHANDPATSHEAAERHTRNGKRNANAQLVLALVETSPGLTASEYWRICTERDREQLKEPQEIRRRLSDMHDVHVKQRSARRCTVKGTKQVTWWPI